MTGKRLGWLNMQVRYKFDAWASRKGLSKEEEMKKYNEFIDRLEGS